MLSSFLRALPLLSFLVFQSQSPALAQNSVTQVGNCAKENRNLELDMFEMDSRYFFARPGAVRVVLRPVNGVCLKAGSEYKMISKEYKTEWGVAPIEKIETISFNEKEKLVKTLQFGNEFIRYWFTNAFGLDAAADKVALVYLGPIKFADVKNKYFPNFALVPHEFPWHLEPVNALRVRAEVNTKKVRLIDLRTPQEFQQFHIPGAINMPYSVAPDVVAQPMKSYAAPDDWVKSVKSDKFDWSKLGDKNEGFIFYGSGLWDLRTKRFNEARFLKGYRGLKWFRGGVSEWTGELTAIPPKVAGLNIVSVDEVKAMQGKELIFVDVRSENDFKGSVRFPGSLNLPYQSTGFRMASLNNTNLDGTVAQLKAQGERIDISKLPKNKPVIFFSWNQYDDAPWKATLTAKQSGHEVYLWRDGLSQWYARSLMDPTNYKAEVTKASLW